MGQHKGGQGQRRIQRRTVYGEPMVLGERSLVPVADIVTLGRARGTIGKNWVHGQGWGAAQVTPRAVIVQEAGGEGRVEIVDATARLICRLAAAALLTSAALALARRLLRHRRAGTG